MALNASVNAGREREREREVMKFNWESGEKMTKSQTGLINHSLSQQQ